MNINLKKVAVKVGTESLIYLVMALGSLSVGFACCSITLKNMDNPLVLISAPFAVFFAVGVVWALLIAMELGKFIVWFFISPLFLILFAYNPPVAVFVVGLYFMSEIASLYVNSALPRVKMKSTPSI